MTLCPFPCHSSSRMGGGGPCARLSRVKRTVHKLCCISPISPCEDILGQRGHAETSLDGLNFVQFCAKRAPWGEAIPRTWAPSSAPESSRTAVGQSRALSLFLGPLISKCSNCGHSGWPSDKPAVDVTRARVSAWKSTAIFSPIPGLFCSLFLISLVPKSSLFLMMFSSICAPEICAPS